MARPRPPGHDALLAAWGTNSRVTAFLVERIPDPLWRAAIPGIPTRTVRSIAAHLHNARCRWVKTLGSEHGIAHPARVDQRTVTPRELVAALEQSGRGIAALLELGNRHGGHVPLSKAYEPMCGAISRSTSSRY
jgi:hypothetical protein